MIPYKEIKKTFTEEELLVLDEDKYRFIGTIYNKGNWKEILKINENLSEEFLNKYMQYIDFIDILENQKYLSEKFILNNIDKIDWYILSYSQKLSENFIEEYSNKLDWHVLSEFQQLSEDFIEKHLDKINWSNISYSQKLSEKFIEKYIDRLNINAILRTGKRSVDFIIKYLDLIDDDLLLRYCDLDEDFITNHILSKSNIDNNLYDKLLFYQNSQKFTEPFILKCLDKLNYHQKDKFKLTHPFNDNNLIKRKMYDIERYAINNKLEFDGENLIAYRNHDQWGRGYWSRNTFYEKGKYYRDWHCDMNNANDCSFGYSILNRGNTKVKINIKDWGTSIFDQEYRMYGLARVWGFTVIGRVD